MSKKLNISENDLVFIKRGNNIVGLTQIVKILPNGRFKTSIGDFYFRADGTMNTRARKLDREIYCELADIMHYKKAFVNGIANRLLVISNQFDLMGKDFPTEVFLAVNRLLDTYEMPKNGDLEHFYKRIKELECKGE